jgi:hypothetical protein
MRWGWSLLLVAGCDRLLHLDDIHATDAAIDAVPCMSTLVPGDFSMHSIALPSVGTPSLTMDQSLMYVTTSGTISYSTYAGAWSAPAPVPTLSAAGFYEDHPNLSYDGQHIYFTRHPMTGGYDQPYEATKIDAASETWGPVDAVVYPSALAGNDVVYGVPTTDGNRVVASHGRNGFNHLAELVLSGGVWTVVDTTAALYAPGGDVSDTAAQLSPDGCWLLFARIDRQVDTVDHDVMIATRMDDGTFGAPEKLFTNVSTQNEQHPWLSPDGATLYFFVITPEVYVAHRR